MRRFREIRATVGDVLENLPNPKTTNGLPEEITLDTEISRLPDELPLEWETDRLPEFI